TLQQQVLQSIKENQEILTQQATLEQMLIKIISQKVDENYLRDSYQQLLTLEQYYHALLLRDWRAASVAQFYQHSLNELKINLKQKPLKVFISYSWGDPVTVAKVHWLAQHLKLLGIEMVLDIWHNKPGTSIEGFTHEIRYV